MLNLGYPKWSN